MSRFSSRIPVDNHLIFDFETNGLDVVNDAIMQMTVRDGIDGSLILNEYVWPWNGKYSETSFSFHGIDRTVLKQNNALNLRELLIKLVEMTRKRYGRRRVVWVAYNCFAFDQLFFESAFKHMNMRMPVNWWFMDLYPFIANNCGIVEEKGKGNLKLANAHRRLCGETTALDLTNLRLHDSSVDTQCLYELYRFCYEKFGRDCLERTAMRPRVDSACIFDQPCSILFGYKWGMKLGEKHDVWTVGDMYKVFWELGADSAAFKRHLEKNWGIWGGKCRWRMTNQLEKIHRGFRFDLYNKYSEEEIDVAKALLNLKNGRGGCDDDGWDGECNGGCNYDDRKISMAISELAVSVDVSV